MTLQIALALCVASGGVAKATMVAPAIPAEAYEVLQEGDVYLNSDLPAPENAVKVQAIVDIAAPPGVVWDIVIDFDARVRDSWVVDSAAVYRDESTGDRLDKGIRWRLSIMGVDIVYHTNYKGSRSQGVVDWALDTTQENDIVDGSGRYQVIKIPGRGGGSRLVYTFEATSRRSVGRGLRAKLTNKNVIKLMEQIRKRSEKRA